MKKIIYCLYEAGVKMINDDGVEHSGYMSFMVLLSIFPFVIFFIALTSFVGASELGQYFVQIILDGLPQNSTEAIRDRVNELGKSPPQSLMTLAIVGTVWTSSSFVECLRTILNRVYEIKSPPPYITRRLLSIAQFLIISAAITFTMFLLVIIPIALSKIQSVLEIIQGYEAILNFFRYFFILMSLFLGASSLYYIVPNAKLKFVHVLPGAFLAVILWIISGYLLSTYIIYYHQLSLVYGSLGSIIITLLFFYVINMIFIYGAEFNYLLHKKNIE